MWLEPNLGQRNGAVLPRRSAGRTGLGEDRRFEKIGRDYFHWTAKHDAHWVNKRTIANIGVVMGQRTQLFYKPPHDVTMPQYMDGMYYALLEGRFLFDFVHEDRLQLERMKTILGSDSAQHRAAERRAMPAVARLRNKGGSLLATFETSMYNERTSGARISGWLMFSASTRPER